MLDVVSIWIVVEHVDEPRQGCASFKQVYCGTLSPGPDEQTLPWSIEAEEIWNRRHGEMSIASDITIEPVSVKGVHASPLCFALTKAPSSITDQRPSDFF